MPILHWQKSSYSQEASSCVYVAATPRGTIHLRESEAPEAILTTTPDRLRPLISHIKAGALTQGQT
ncbi:DUF397 domain-containing protein [Streptomyces albireticuli]|uniref:DUF397 domain-containing protein n=1 Tax=Streptomyces albireticuli TaxID=1940 RepID=A0A2A2D0Y1_9ACTN|nr:DUF397 domain-containing protein [Streptomyces albireticuli]MCD9141801.1 DUF397 domain-containing protein [Streptomyces albireticuli]MCD9163255.1 DUF397 domain-containing protein [Streptomyces albireticuli]MCD9189975.1 DUF397 domain-containing protein [Streptomyces albireticuli]PAU45076.1 DUF397 domain-containing protein [Streptomyces albireticuli]